MTYYLNQYCPVRYLIFNIVTAKTNHKLWYVLKHMKGKKLFTLLLWGKINFCDKTSCLEYFLLITYCCDVSL